MSAAPADTSLDVELALRGFVRDTGAKGRVWVREAAPAISLQLRKRKDGSVRGRLRRPDVGTLRVGAAALARPERLLAVIDVWISEARGSGLAPSALPGVSPEVVVAEVADALPATAAPVMTAEVLTPLIEQLGALHTVTLDLVDARERAARAETEVHFLRERLAALESELDAARALPPAPSPSTQPELSGSVAGPTSAATDAVRRGLARFWRPR